MCINEFIFLFHSIVVSLFVVLALKIGKKGLIVLLCLQAVLSNLFVSKQIIIWGLCSTCSDIFSIGSSLSLNLIQEYYGKEIARKAILVSFFGLLFYLVMSQIHLLYVPINLDSVDITHSAFVEILQFAPRFSIASLIAYIISLNLDSILYAYFRTKFHGRFFIIRNYGSIIISQFVDTALFTVLGLYGVLPNLSQVFVVSYGIKILSILIATPIVALCKKFVGKIK